MMMTPEEEKRHGWHCGLREGAGCTCGELERRDAAEKASARNVNELIAAHEATNAKLELRVAHLEGANTGLAQAISDKCREEESLREQVAMLTQFKQYVHERLDVAGVEKNPTGPHADAGCRIGQRIDLVFSQLDAAKADAARLRALASDCKWCGPELAHMEADTDSAAWLESKIAERTASILQLNEMLSARLTAKVDEVELHEEREKSLTQQLVAATNDAARAELRARDLAKVLSALVPDTETVGRGVERGAACGRNYLAVNGCAVAMEGDVCREVGYGERWTREDFDKIEAAFKAPIVTALAVSPDSDERLREVMVTACERAASAVGVELDSDEMFKRVVDEVLGGGA